MPSKGGHEALKYATAEICRFLNVLGHTEVTLKSDGEPTCMALKASIKAYRAKLGLRTHLEQPQAGDHQSVPAEQAIEGLRQLAGTLLGEYEKMAGVSVSSLHPLHGWAWRHAGWLQQRYVKHAGLTSFELTTGRPYQGRVVSFGESLWSNPVSCQREASMAQDAVAWKVTCIRWPHRTYCRWIFGCVSIREAHS